MYNDHSSTDNQVEDNADKAYNAGYQSGLNGRGKTVPNEFLTQSNSWQMGWDDGSELLTKQTEINQFRDVPDPKIINLLKKLIKDHKK